MNKQDAIKCLKSIQQWVPDFDNREDGLSYWDAIDMAIDALSLSNEPLTLEQLREMNEEPVWCQYIGDTTFASWWMIVDCEMNKCSSGEWELPFEDEPDDAYGRTWLAYRHPPEGET